MKLDANKTAVDLASHEDALGAIVIVLTTTGELDISLVCSDDQDVSAPLLGIRDAIQKHCDERHRLVEAPIAPTGDN